MTFSYENNSEHDNFLDESCLSDASFCLSEPDTQPQSINIDLQYGSPFKNDDFLVMHYNINSITAEGRLTQIYDVASTTKADVIIFTESKLDQTIPNNTIGISGYHEPLRRDRNRHGGGCLIYILQNLTFKQQCEFQSDHFEHIWVDVRVNEKIYSINCLYRPPDTENHDIFLNECNVICSKLSNHKSDNKVILSDLNFGNIYCKYPILDSKPLDNVAPELFSSFGFHQLIDIPTRITKSTLSLIDLAFVSDLDNIQSFGTLPGIADHEGTFVNFHCIRPKCKNIYRTVYDYKNIDEQGLLKYIKGFDYESTVFSLPITEQAEYFSNFLTETVVKFVPTKKVVMKPTDQPWLCSYTRLLIRRKNRNYQFFKKVNCQYRSSINNPNISEETVTRLKNKKDKAHSKFRSASNESNKANRRAKQAFFNSVNATMHNSSISAKKKFNILKRLMKNNKIANIPPLFQNGNVINDAQTKSNIFNELFANKATVSGNDDPIPILPEKNDITSSLDNINTSPIEVARLIRNIKKSNASHCGIPGKFLSLIATPISFPMYRLFNNLFEIGHFPDIFKVSHITALWKRSGLKSDPNMYRPVSLLPTISKVMESILHKRLLDHFIDNKIISERQSAYLKGESTIQQLLYIIHFIRNSWTKGNITQGVFLDVSAAFDKCWHSGILSKLSQVKVKDSCHDLFKSYLSNRKQIVVVEGCKSETKCIEAGVPQGSRVGPLLWILYINDIVDNLESEVFLFADDTCLFVSGKDPALTAEILNRDLLKINEWSTRWKVTFNPKKSKDIIFSNNKVLFNSPPIMFNDTYVERTHEHKHLGVWLSSSLSWSKHIHETCLKANGKLAVLRSVNFLDRSTLDLLYKLTVRSVIDYSLILYYNTLKQTEIARLSQIQYRAAKLCTGTMHGTSQAKVECDLGWETISDRAIFLGLSVFHKIHIGQSGPLIKKCMPQVNTKYSLRNHGNYENFSSFCVKFNNSFFPFFTRKWNILDKTIKSEQDLSLFKQKLKLLLKPKKHKHFQRGLSKFSISMLTQLRVGHSKLNLHLYTINKSDTDLCICSKVENVSHFFLKCYLYNTERMVLFAKISIYVQNFVKLPDYKKLNIILYGIYLDNDDPDCRNIPITMAVQEYILKTKRFINM